MTSTFSFNHPVKRAGQLVKIAGAVARVRRAGNERDQEIAERALASLMADARGIPMKIGQFLAQGEAPGGAYEALVTSIAPRPLAEVEAQIEASLGCPIGEIFQRFDESRAAASLGQVHRATLHDGTEVAVKVRYPGIVDAVRAELRLAGLIPGIGPIKRWGFEIDAYRKLLSGDLERELDYRGEAERQDRAQRELKVSGLVVPTVYLDLCREDLLVQSWEDGVSLETFSGTSPSQRMAAAEILLRTLFESVFVHGEIHADPHMGNLLFRTNMHGDVEVVLLDWGCTLELEQERRVALLSLIRSYQLLDKRAEGDSQVHEIPLIRTYAAMGFDPEKLVSIAASLPALGKILLAPFLVDDRLNAETWRLSERIERLLGEHRWWFRASGPADSLLLLRAFGGLMQQFATLKVALPWRSILKSTIRDALWAEARDFEPPKLSAATEAKIAGSDTHPLAHSLKVQVLENDQQKVMVTFPAEVALDLESIIPDDVKEMIRAERIDIAALLERVKESGISPQNLIELERPPKAYRIWLE